MPRSAFLLFPFGILLAVACKKDDLAAHNSYLAPLQGQWQWIQQTRSKALFGNPDSTITAASADIKEFLNINGDLTWSLVADGRTIRNGTYRVDSAATPGGYIKMLAFAHNGQDSLVDHWFTSTFDTLYTADPEVNPTWNVDMYVRHGIGID
jgi:hypothetical protein